MLCACPRAALPALWPGCSPTPAEAAHTPPRPSSPRLPRDNGIRRSQPQSPRRRIPPRPWRADTALHLRQDFQTHFQRQRSCVKQRPQILKSQNRANGPAQREQPKDRPSGSWHGQTCCARTPLQACPEQLVYRQRNATPLMRASSLDCARQAADDLVGGLSFVTEHHCGTTPPAFIVAAHFVISLGKIRLQIGG